MVVTIELFGTHRIKAETEVLTMTIDSESVVADALDFVKSKHPDLHIDKESMLITVNRTVVPLNKHLKENDVIRFLPPIGGG